MPEQNKKLEVKKQKVFDYMVLLHPTIEGAEKGETTDIVVPLKQVCADDEQGAFVMASRAIPEEHVKDLSRLEVVIRPF